MLKPKINNSLKINVGCKEFVQLRLKSPNTIFKKGKYAWLTYAATTKSKLLRNENESKTL